MLVVVDYALIVVTVDVQDALQLVDKNVVLAAEQIVQETVIIIVLLVVDLDAVQTAAEHVVVDALDAAVVAMLLVLVIVVVTVVVYVQILVVLLVVEVVLVYVQVQPAKQIVLLFVNRNV